MKCLAIDTSSKAGSVAIVEDGALLAEVNEIDTGRHATWLMGAIDGLLIEAGLDIHAIDLFALSIGPGSFTGLRIGVSTIKGLAWSLRKPIIGVSTLKALALNLASGTALISPVLDARKKEIYGALYAPDGKGSVETLIPDMAATPASFIELLSNDVARAGEPSDIIFIGNGLDIYKAELTSGVASSVAADEADSNVLAKNVASLALAGDGQEFDALELAPLYLRKSEAELKRKKTKER